MRSFRQYCKDLGLGNDSSPEQFAEAKSTYTKWYQKAYREARKQKVVRREISLIPKEDKALLKFADTFGLTPSQCIKHCTLGMIYAYTPKIEPKALTELIIQIRRVGTNLNQVVYKINRLNKVQDYDIRVLQHHLIEIETLVRQHLRLSNTLPISNDLLHSQTRKHITSVLTNDH